MAAKSDKPVPEMKPPLPITPVAKPESGIAAFDSAVASPVGEKVLDEVKAEELAAVSGPATTPAPLEAKIEDFAHPFRKAVVACPGTHVKAIPVSIPRTGSENDMTLAAIAAAKKAFGIQAFGAGPVVQFID